MWYLHTMEFYSVTKKSEIMKSVDKWDGTEKHT